VGSEECVLCTVKQTLYVIMYGLEEQLHVTCSSDMALQELSATFMIHKGCLANYTFCSYVTRLK
jgi:hypothetical protein